MLANCRWGKAIVVSLSSSYRSGEPPTTPMYNPCYYSFFLTIFHQSGG